MGVVVVVVGMTVDAVDDVGGAVVLVVLDVVVGDGVQTQEPIVFAALVLKVVRFPPLHFTRPDDGAVACTVLSFEENEAWPRPMPTTRTAPTFCVVSSSA